MTGNAFSLAFAPLLPWPAIAALGARACVWFSRSGFCAARAGLLWRAVAVAILLAALVNPSLIEEKRAPQRDIAIIVVDESPSQRIGDRQHATEAALAALSDRLVARARSRCAGRSEPESRSRAPATTGPGCSPR